MKFIPFFSLSVLHLYYETQIVNRSINMFILLTDVLIIIFQSVELVDLKVSVVLLFFVIVS